MAVKWGTLFPPVMGIQIWTKRIRIRTSLRTVYTELKKYTFSTINSEYTKKFQKDHNTEYSRYFLSKETIIKEILLNM